VTGPAPGAPHVVRVSCGDTLVLSLVGEFDLASADVLRSAFVEALRECDHVVLDLARTGFLDSTALGSILAASRRAGETSGGWLRLANPPKHIRRVLQVTGIGAVLGLHDTVEEAGGHAEGEPMQTVASPVDE
jgi:anti-sigma B factor antagonist